MRRAGVREARQNLSVLLEYVQEGHEIVITDRGRPVARLVAPLPLSPKSFPGRARFRRSMPELRPPLSSALAEGAPLSAPRRGWAAPLSGPLYLDPTALAKLYLPEPDSEVVEAALVGRRDLVVSDLSLTELVAALAQEKRAAPAARAAMDVQGTLLQDLESGFFRRIEMSPRTHRAAERLALSAKQESLTARMAMHLALAMTATVASLVTFDRTLARAAHAVGLAVIPEPRPR